jgi:hypothetical protein
MPRVDQKTEGHYMESLANGCKVETYMWRMIHRSKAQTEMIVEGLAGAMNHTPTSLR